MKVGEKAIIIILVCLLCSLIGYEWGRHKTPTKVVTQVHTVTVDHDVIHTVTQVQKQIVYVAKENKDIHRVVVVDKKPTGEIVTTTTVQDNSKIATSDTQNQIKNQNQVQDRIVYQDKIVTKTITNNVRPEWIIGARSGFNLGESNGPNLLSIAGVPNRITLGAEIDKHLFSGFYGGVWFDSNKVGGIALHLEF